MICAFIQVLNYYNAFSNKIRESVDIDGICIYLAIFCISWLLLGIYHVFISQIYINEWEEFESNVDIREEIYRRYETLHLKRSKGSLFFNLKALNALREIESI